MKQPRKLRQKIDSKFIKREEGSELNHPSMLTVWNSQNPSIYAPQVPFPNAQLAMESSFGIGSSAFNIKSPQFSKRETVKNVSKYGDV